MTTLQQLRGAPAHPPLDPVRRMEGLFDARTLRLAPPDSHGDRIGVRTAVGEVHGRPVVAYAQDAAVAGGSVGTAEADTIVRALQTAGHLGAPVVAFLESAGARLQEGAASLGGFGRIFFENVALSGRVPQVSVVTGPSAGGGCYSPALTDFVVMTRAAAMFLTGPRVVMAALGEDVAASELGGPAVHERNGVCHLVADDDQGAIELVRELLGCLDGRAHGNGRPGSGPQENPGSYVPREPRRVYDVRDVIGAIVDAGRFLEISPRWARNLVTGFARVEGRAVGVIANQPRHLGGVLDAQAAEKGARFVATCDANGVPLVVLVDTPGFLPGQRQETAGVIRHGAQLVRAFAAATVVRVTVILRKAYGGAYITMNAKHLGADAAFAWAGAEVGVMGPRAAVGILHRRELAAARRATPLADRLADDYAARHVVADRAFELGLLDAVIAPHETRRHVAAALHRVSATRESSRRRRSTR